MPNAMKDTIIKTIASIAALLGLLMLVGDMPDAGLIRFATVKAAGFAILWGAVKVWERYIPDESI